MSTSISAARKGIWDEWEDDILLDAYESAGTDELGDTDLDDLAAFLANRTKEEIAERLDALHFLIGWTVVDEEEAAQDEGTVEFVCRKCGKAFDNPMLKHEHQVQCDHIETAVSGRRVGGNPPAPALPAPPPPVEKRTPPPSPPPLPSPGLPHQPVDSGRVSRWDV